MFTPRPTGTTLRRIEEALAKPHDFAERMDPWFIVEMRCSKCGKLARAPRCQMSEAMREHLETTCPARHGRHADDGQMMRVFYPRQ